VSRRAARAQLARGGGRIPACQLLGVLHSPQLPARLVLRGLLRPFVRVQFLVTAAEMGVLEALRSPASAERIGESLAVTRPDLLERLLAVGVSVGELRRQNGAYQLRGRLARALSRDDGDVLLAAMQELVGYHAAVYRDLPEQLRGGPAGDYLDGREVLIARSSRIVEPATGELLDLLVGPDRPVTVLDVGCGSGGFLRRVAQASPLARGIGIDKVPEVVEHAKRNLRLWDLADRFDVIHADIRSPAAELSGPFDLVLLSNNLYYFEDGELPSLFETLRSRLRPSGVLVVVSLMRGASITAAELDLILAATKGCGPLPEEEHVAATLRDGGFDVRRFGLLPGEPFVALLATRI
jgi:4-hydroxy-2,2'-bipyrrole-5-carbaldehyde O-methyltransferase